MYQRMDSQKSTCNTCRTLCCLYPILLSLGNPLLRATQVQLLVVLQVPLCLFANGKCCCTTTVCAAACCSSTAGFSRSLQPTPLSPNPFHIPCIMYSTTTYQSVCDSTYCTLSSLTMRSLCVFLCNTLITILL